MEQEQTLTIREIANAYLEYNGLTISYMSRATKIPNTTLREWMDGKKNISTKNLIRVKRFLEGDFLLDVNTIIHHLLLSREVADEEAGTDRE